MIYHNQIIINDGVVLMFLLEEKKKDIKQLGKYRKIKTNDPMLGEECPICLERFEINKFKRILNCNHTFHKKCIDRWIREDIDKHKCPVCRDEPFKK